MPDQPTSVERTGAFVALVQALCATALASAPRPYAPGERGVYQQNRWAALRAGLDARLVHPDGDRTVPARELARELLELVEPAARELDSAELLGALTLDRTEADEQLTVGDADGVPAVTAELVARTLRLPSWPSRPRRSP